MISEKEQFLDELSADCPRPHANGGCPSLKEYLLIQLVKGDNVDGKVLTPNEAAEVIRLSVEYKIFSPFTGLMMDREYLSELLAEQPFASNQLLQEAMKALQESNQLNLYGN
jgi:hypothetical protein